MGAALRVRGFLTVFLFVPLAAVFAQAFADGAGAYRRAVTEPEAWSAIRLTLLTALSPCR